MQKITVDGKELPIFHEVLNGQDVLHFAEEADEGGAIVTNTLVISGETVLNYRTWRGAGAKRDPAVKAAARSEALTNFKGMTDIEREARSVKAAETGVSGTLRGQTP